jgi:glycosyltransferase involved in cell wall biosynthesis
VNVRGRVGLQQRVLPAYRAAFFDALAARCPDGLSVAAGEPRPREAILPASGLTVARWEHLRNVHLLGGVAYACLQLGWRAWLESWDPAILILEANPRDLTNWRLAAWMRSKRRPVLGWGLGARGRRGVGGWIRRAFTRRLDGAIAYSRRGAAEFVRSGLSAERVWVAPNAVAPAPTDLPPKPPATETTARVIFVGRLQARKRVDVLLEACAALRPAPEVWIVGDGPARFDLVREAEGLGAQARFFGPVHGEAVERLLDAADLFVLPGTGGLAAQQAMSRGLPLIVAEGDGTQEDLVSPENGWLVTPGNVDALRVLVQEALSNRDRLREMGRASHRLAREKFNLEAMVDVFVQALNEVGRAS